MTLGLVFIADLKRFVAILLFGLLRHNGVGKNLDHGDGIHSPIGSEDLGHAHFSSDNGFHDGDPPYFAVTSMSTPLGRASFRMASTVSFVGLTMSINLLCVRISNCSRLSLYLNVARRTVYTCFSV